MVHFEYKVVPAPLRGDKVKGVKSADARFAHSVEAVLNRMAEGGWEYVRAEMLPSEERAGLSKTTTEWRNLLIFRRNRGAPDAVHPDVIAQPDVSAPPDVSVVDLVDPPVEAPVSVAPAAEAAPLVARPADLPDSGFAEAPAAHRAEARPAPASEGRGDTGAAEAADPVAAPDAPDAQDASPSQTGATIPFRPLRGWRDRT